MIRLVVEIDPSALPPETAEAMRSALVAVMGALRTRVEAPEPLCSADTPCVICRRRFGSGDAEIEPEKVTAPAESNSPPTCAVHLARPGLGSTYCDRPLPGDTDLWTYRGEGATCEACVDALGAEILAHEGHEPAPRNPLVRGPRNCGCRARGPHRRACPEAA